MANKTRVVASAGGNPVVFAQFDNNNLDLSGPYGLLQLSCTGLDGGTYKVEALLPENPDYMEHSTGVAENKPVIVDWPAVEGLKITFAGLGGAAAAKVVLTQRGRASAFGSGA